MKRTIFTAVLLSVAVAVLVGAGPASGQAASARELSITDLGTLPGGDFSLSSAQDINSRGQVVGVSTTASGDFHAVLWAK